MCNWPMRRLILEGALSLKVRETDAVELQEIQLARHLLGNCVLFGGLSADERAAVVAQARIRTVNAGETVFAMGSPGDQMMALLNGTIRISVPSLEGRNCCSRLFGLARYSVS